MKGSTAHRNAFILRIAPSRIDRMDEALASDQIMIGWSRAPELLDPSLEWDEFRESSLMLSLGAEKAPVVPRQQDKGADILATFRLAGAFQFVVAVQCKHYHPEPPVGPEVVEQLIRGLEAEAANLGMVVTSGSFTDEATPTAEAYFEEKGVKIELIDGPQLAALIVEHGLRLS